MPRYKKLYKAPAIISPKQLLRHYITDFEGEALLEALNYYTAKV